MVIKQSTAKRNQVIVWKAALLVLVVGAGIEVSGYLENERYRVLSTEYSILITASFILAFAYIWLTDKRNLKIEINDRGFEYSHDEGGARFTWFEIKKIKHPSVFRRFWIFELKQGKTLKIPTTHFDRKQVRAVKQKLKHLPLR
jgi:hypothetical protein